MDSLLTSRFFESVETAALEPAPHGSLVLVERHGAAGAMGVLYRRDQDETYLVAEGELTFFLGEETVVARPGDVAVAPPGVARTFRVESDRARWLVLTRVASAARFEDFGRALARPSGRELSDDDAAALCALADVNGIEILGPPGRLPARV